MSEKDDLSNGIRSEIILPKNKKPFTGKEEKKQITINLFNNSNDSIINNTNNDFMDEDDIDVDEENIFEKTIGEKFLHTPINESHRLFTNKNRFGKTFINSYPLRRILIPKSKSPNIKNYGNFLNRNEIKLSNDNLKKNLTTNNVNNVNNTIFSSNNDFLHCRNCMLIVALNRYGKYYFNK